MDVDDAVAVRAHHLQNIAAASGDLPGIGCESDQRFVDQAQNCVDVVASLDGRPGMGVQTGGETDLAAVVTNAVERVGEASELVRRIAIRGPGASLQNERFAAGQGAK